jgi:predicted MPP superfamily phosphohydrolase
MLRSVTREEIELAREPITRRSFLKRSVWGLLGVLGATMYGGYHAYAEAPFAWQSNTVDIRLATLPKALDGLRIAHFSDTHFGYHFDVAHFLPIAEQLRNFKADIMIFTGDMFHPDCVERQQIIRLLQSLQAPLGQFAVLGNHDYFYGKKKILSYFRESGFTLLLNEHRLIQHHGVDIRLAGVDDQTYGWPDLQSALLIGAEPRTKPAVPFTILLSHAPDFADEARKHPVHLQLSGHSHGGQIRIPGIGHLGAPLHGRKYVDGLFRWPDSELVLFTNRGIGTSRVPLRMYCPPEINLLILRHDR